MHQVAHVERHFTASELVRDIVIGMADGLTVPFALAAGLSGTERRQRRWSSRPGSPKIAAGSIAMGLGGYLAAKSDAEHYRQRETPRGEPRSSPFLTSNARRSPRFFANTGWRRPKSSRSCKRLKRTIPPGSIS